MIRIGSFKLAISECYLTTLARACGVCFMEWTARSMYDAMRTEYQGLVLTSGWRVHVSEDVSIV